MNRQYFLGLGVLLLPYFLTAQAAWTSIVELKQEVVVEDFISQVNPEKYPRFLANAPMVMGKVKKLREEVNSKSRITFEFNAKGGVTSTRIADIQTGEPTFREEYSYDNKGRLKRKEYSNVAEDLLLDKTLFRYKGNYLEEEVVFGKEDPASNQFNRKARRKHSYTTDALGKRIALYDGVKTESYRDQRFDQAGNIVFHKYYERQEDGKDELIWESYYSYDEEGRLIKSEYKDMELNATYNTMYRRNAKGQIESKEYAGFKDVFLYNDKGELVERQLDKENCTWRYTYDDHGNVILGQRLKNGKVEYEFKRVIQYY